MKPVNLPKKTKTTSSAKAATVGASKKSNAKILKETKAATPSSKKTTATKTSTEKTTNTMKLVIVESPRKAKTILQYLGKNYIVLACNGHIYDLPKKNGVDTKNNFEQNFQLVARNKKNIDAIVNAAKKCSDVLIATDPDREGEAIAWHIEDHLLQQKSLKNIVISRVTFNQITKTAIQEAIANPRSVYKDLVDAQKARRGLDYLVGFNLSPLLWKKVRPGLSAGRVQSPALRMISEREIEIRAFTPTEYWDIWAEFDNGFSAKLVIHQNKKLTAHTIGNAELAQSIQELYQKHASLKVMDIKKKNRTRKPYPPFQTSTLQQESSKQLGFSATRTMSIAQGLYEGVDINGTLQGLITYMRTDSTHMAEEAIDQMRQHISSMYGDSYLPKSPRLYAKSQKNAQEAHEAIRPNDIRLTPRDMAKILDKDALKLYDLIWRRALSSQMNDAEMEQQTILFSSGQNDQWRLTGTRITFDGFLKVFKVAEDDEEESFLPKTTIDDSWNVLKYPMKQHFTEPPPRYTEASLIKTLEEFGIGRPSTYATIPTTLIKREYVTLDKKRFQPTPIGEIVSQFLVNYFTQYVDYDFTAGLETSLDDIAQGQNSYTQVMQKFWDPFTEQVQKINTEVSRSDVTSESTGEACPECSADLLLKLGRAGRFIGCSAYPTCTYTRPLIEDNIPEADHPCPKCDAALIKRVGRYGPFYGCSTYPNCKHIESIKDPSMPSDITCPICNQGQMVSKKSRFNKIFYACNGYPDCKYALWNPPLKQSCSNCQWPIVTIKTTKRHGEQIVCPQCQHTTQAPIDSESSNPS